MGYKFPSHVSVSDNCKQLITVWLITINILLTLSQNSVGPTNGENCLKTTNYACRRCGRSSSPTAWFTQNVWVRVVDSTAGFLNSAQLSPFVGVSLEMMAFSPSPCSRSVCIQYSKHDMVKTMGTHGKINAIWWNFKINDRNWRIYVDMNCQQICKISHRDSTEVKIFQKV